MLLPCTVVLCHFATLSPSPGPRPTCTWSTIASELFSRQHTACHQTSLGYSPLSNLVSIISQTMLSLKSPWYHSAFLKIDYLQFWKFNQFSLPWSIRQISVVNFIVFACLATVSASSSSWTEVLGQRAAYLPSCHSTDSFSSCRTTSSSLIEIDLGHPLLPPMIRVSGLP